MNPKALIGGGLLLMVLWALARKDGEILTANCFYTAGIVLIWMGIAVELGK